MRSGRYASPRPATGDQGFARSGTDAAFAAASGLPAVAERFGLVGFGFHSSEEEYVELNSIEPRLYLLARLIVKQNGADESFNGKFRDECLNTEWFRNRTEARVLIEQWRQHYNAVRPHSSLQYKTPNEFHQAFLVANPRAILQVRLVRNSGGRSHACYFEFYNSQRPHSALAARTPDAAYLDRTACRPIVSMERRPSEHNWCCVLFRCRVIRSRPASPPSQVCEEMTPTILVAMVLASDAIAAAAFVLLKG